MAFLSRLFLLVSLCVLSFSTSIFASPLRLGADIAYSFYEDTNGALSFEEFLDIPEEKLTESHRILSKGYTNSVFWVKAEINDESFKDKDYWLEILPTYLDDIEFYYKKSNSSDPWIKRTAGDFNDNSEWDFDYRSPVYILPPSNEGYSFLFRIKTSSSMVLNVKVWKEQDFIYHALKNNTFWLFFFGFFSFAALTFFLLAIVMKKREFWVSFLSTTIYFNVFCVQGYFDWGFGRNGFHIQHYLVCMTSIMTFCVALLMCTELLGRRDKNKKIYFFIDFTLMVMMAQSFLIVFDMYLIAIRVVYILFCICSCVVFYLCFLSFLGNKLILSRLLIGLGVILLLLVGLYRVLTLNNFIFYPEGDGYFWQILVAIITFFMMGVTALNFYKEKIQDIERKSLIRELNIERETRFHQRQFVSIVSHEFRTSLSIISGAITNLLNFYDNDEQIEKRYKRIERANKRLIQLTDNCLADDRLSSKVQGLQLRRESLSKIILNAADLIYMSDHHSIKFSLNGRVLELIDFPELLVEADFAMLQIAFSNIFDNALKYMEEGCLEVGVYVKEDFYIVDILDHGIGIDKNKEDEIFDKYKKLTQSDIGSKPGVGLGLYVCKNILVSHGGDVTLLHNSNKGCCFQFKIPKLMS